MWKIVAICVLLLIPSMALPMGQVPQAGSDAALIGKPTPDFTLDLLSGDKKSLTQVRGGKKAMLIFWATWCPHCQIELQALSRAAADIEKKGIKIILVDLGETKGEVHNYFKYNNITLDSFVDMDSITQDMYNLIGIPTVYFIDEQGITRSIQHAIPSDYESMFQK